MKRIEIIGNLAQDAEIHVINAKRSVVNFTVAQNERWTDKASGEKREVVEYFDCSYFRNAEDAEKMKAWLKKGIMVFVEGDPSVRAFIKKDNLAYGTIKIEVVHVRCLTPMNKDNSQSS